MLDQWINIGFALVATPPALIAVSMMLVDARSAVGFIAANSILALGCLFYVALRIKSLLMLHLDRTL